MGNVLFGVDVAGIIADAMGDGLLAVTVTRDVRGVRQSGNLTGGRAASTQTFDWVGFWDDVEPGSVPPGVELEETDRRLVLLGDTGTAEGLPRRNDLCTVHEDGGDLSLYCVQQLRRDPAGAVYSYLCRDRRGPDGE